MSCWHSRAISPRPESKATAVLRLHWNEYKQEFERLIAEPDPARRSALYFDALLPAFGRVTNASDHIRALNQDAMVRKSERVARVSQQLNRVLIAVADRERPEQPHRHPGRPPQARETAERRHPVYSEHGDVFGTTVVLQDVTRLLRVDELRNDLVATVAHEFRTPLTSLRMALHLLIEQAAGPLSDKQSDLLHAAREDCERLQAMVDELLDLSRIQAGRLSLRTVPLSVDVILASALDTQRASADEHRVTLQSQVFPGLADVHADPERVQLVFGNLLSNAIRYSPAGSTVTVRAARADGHIRFEISDQGPGIAQQYQDAIFEKYLQLPGERPGDAGLGLFIAREIVHAHSGQLGVASEPGHGSTFWFTLPVAEP